MYRLLGLDSSFRKKILWMMLEPDSSFRSTSCGRCLDQIHHLEALPVDDAWARFII